MVKNGLMSITQTEKDNNSFMNQKAYRLLSIIYIVVLTIASINPTHHTAQDTVGSFSKQLLYNLAHFPAYFLLTYLVIMSGNRQSRAWMGWSFILAVGYGLLMEYAQSFVPERTMSLSDVGSNAIGALSALVWRCFEQRNRKKSA